MLRRWPPPGQRKNKKPLKINQGHQGGEAKTGRKGKKALAFSLGPSDLLFFFSLFQQAGFL